MIRFYSPDILQTGRLPEDESVHCARVLRLKEGDEIETVDGAGYSYTCRITKASPKGVEVEILERREEPKNWGPRLTLAVAPTKNADRMEWLVEKAVELGIEEIVLLKCEHSERKVMKLDRVTRIMVSAMKQSLKASMPVLRGPVPIADFLGESRDKDACRVFGYCSPSVERQDFGDVYKPNENLIIMIGPEGDFSPVEVAEAIKAGFVPVTLGKSRLRTETAALYGVVAFHVINNSGNGICI